MIRLPANFPETMTGTEIFAWIAEAERFGARFPQDYTLEDGSPLPDPTQVDIDLVYRITKELLPPGLGDLPGGVPAIERTDEVAARLGAGARIQEVDIRDTIEGWNDTTPLPKKVLDIVQLIATGKVDY